MYTVKRVSAIIALSSIIILGLITIIGKIPITPVPYVPVVYTTSCGQGGYTFEPYPAVYDPELASTPPTMPTSPNASCLSPGSSFTAGPLNEKYADLVSMDKVELVIYHMRVMDHPNGKYWHPKQDPDYYDLDFTYDEGTLSASIPNNIAGQPPTAADIRIFYTNNNGYDREVLLEDGRDGLSDHRLFFVPDYEVILATRRIDIGFDAFERTLTGRTAAGFNSQYPRGWEKYAIIQHASISDSGFPGAARFLTPQFHPETPITVITCECRPQATDTLSSTIVY